MWPFSSLIRETTAKAETEARSVIDFSAFAGTPTYAGVTVDQTTAVNLPAVYKCVSLNAETISSLPVDVYAKRGDTRVPYAEPVWLRSPNPLQTTAEFIAMTQTSLDLDGNAFWMKTVDETGRLVGLWVLAPAAVQVEIADGQLVYWVSTNSGAREPHGPNAVVHLRALTMPGELRGLSPIKCAQQTIGIGMAAEQYGATWFGSGAHLSGVIESPLQMTKEQTDRLQESFTKRHSGISKSNALGVLSGGATYRPISVPPEEAQFLQSRRYSAAEIANLYGVPVEFVGDGSTEGAKGYVTGVAMRFRMWYLTGLLPRITRIEAAFSSLLPRPAFVKFNTNALLRMDPEQRTAFYTAAQLGQWMTRNEIRALEDMNPMEDGDEVLKSVQWQENAPESEEPEEEPEKSEPDSDEESQ